jgi:hypothetical protein
MYKYLAPHHTRAVRRNLLCKWRRRRTGIGQVLVAMPWASDASVNDLSFAERPVLVLTHIRHCEIFPSYLNTATRSLRRHYADAFLRNLLDAANVDVSVRSRRARGGFPALDHSTHQV